YVSSGINTPIVENGFLTSFALITAFSYQTYCTVSSRRLFIRGCFSGNFEPWKDITHSGNFNPANYALLSQVYTQDQALALYVGKSGVETIQNTKTFTHSPIVPNGTLNGHTVNLGQLNLKADKTYVDQQIQQISLTPGPQGQQGIQ